MKRAGGQGHRFGPFLLWLVAALIVAAGCSNPVATVREPPPSPLEPAPTHTESELLAAPDSLQVDGVWLRSDASVWRDFMPGETDHGLRAYVRIFNSGGKSVPAGALPAFVWVIHAHEIWGVHLGAPRYEYNGTVTAASFGGPTWEVRDTVQVVAGIRDSSGTIHLGRCNDAPIVGTS